MSTLRLNTVISADGTGFYSTISKIRGAVHGFAGNLKSQIAAAFGVGAITMFTRKTMEYADNIDELSRSMGVLPEKLQEWEFAAKMAGVPLENLVNFMAKLNQFAQTSKGADLLKQFGIDPKQTMGGLFESVWKQVGKMSQGEGNAFLRTVGGRGASVKMFEMMQQDLTAVSSEARKLGQVMGEQTIARLAELNDRLSMVSKMLMTQFGPALLQVAEFALNAFGRIKGAGAFAGAATMNVSGKEIMHAMAQLITNPEAFANIINKVINNIKTGEPSMMFQSEVDQIRTMIDAFRNYAPYPVDNPNSGVLDETPGRLKKGSIPQGDELIRVGNFLGQGRVAVESVAQQSLNVQKEHKTISRDMLGQLRIIAMQFAKDTIGVP